MHDARQAIIRKRLQYTHPEKLCGYLSGMADAQPAIFGLSPEDYSALRAEFDQNARRAAVELLADEAFATRVGRTPLPAGPVGARRR